MRQKFSFFFLFLACLSKTFGGELAACGWKCPEPCIDKAWICDGYEQCDDNSDEGTESGEGCNLFPESGCPSSMGMEHFKCERTGECFDNRRDAEECEVSSEAPKRECEGGLWKCKDGGCIEQLRVCDGLQHCADGSDESTEEYNGCNRFPDKSKGCHSWRGDLYVPCPAKESICISSGGVDQVNISNPETCRDCPDPDEWRCNNGQCINATFLRNGFIDCMDGSDEVELAFRWYIILLVTMLIVSIGIGVSFSCRALNKQNTSKLFHCNLCSSSRRRNVEQYNSVPRDDDNGDTVDCGSATEDLDQLYPSQDIPLELITLLDDKVNNWERKKRDSISAQIQGSSLSPSSLKSSVILEAKRLYVLLHNDPVQYHHLYMYFANKSATTKELAKITNHLFAWEKEMHGMSKLEVVKCWRLHLGSSALTSMIISSVADQQSLADRCTSTFYPFRQFIRSCRRKYLQVKPKEDSFIYTYATIAYSTFLPFVEASLFYIEKIKNIVYVHIFLTALADLSNNNVLEHPFEFSLVLFMSLAIAVTQILYIFYAVYFAEDVFEFCHEKNCQKSQGKLVLFKILSFIFSPLMPCYVLANHVYYDSKLTITRRHLQMNNDSADAEQSEGRKRITQLERIELYKKACRLQTKSLLYRKLYSYFRVTSAVLESATVVVCLILLLFVTNRPYRSIKLIVGVEHRLYSFFGIPRSLLTELNLMRDVVVLGSVIFSLTVILTALVKYWYQAKNLAISFSGQFVLGLYLFLLTINRLTTAVSLFATTQPLKFDDGTTEPVISLPIATFLFLLILLLRFVVTYFYKMKFVRDWKLGSVVDKWINVLVNTLVVIPFIFQTEPIRVLKEIERKFASSPETTQQKRDSLNGKAKSLRLITGVDTNGKKTENAESLSGFVMPNMNFFTAPLLYDDFRAEIRKIWWSNPTQKLNVETIKKKIYEDRGMRIILNTMKKEDVDQNISITLEHLEYIGMVNCPLLNPRQTKREYFWLLLFVLGENLIALCIELASGGVWTSQGHYYSWDIRLATLGLGCCFLIVYYKKYHPTRDLTYYPACGGWLHGLPVCLCCKEETAVTAPPDELTLPVTQMTGKKEIKENDSQPLEDTSNNETGKEKHPTKTL